MGFPEVAPVPLDAIDRAIISARLREKGKGDSHFYGAWKGGSAKSGGGPMDEAERANAAAESGDLARLADILTKPSDGPLVTNADKAAGVPARFGFSELRGPDKKPVPWGSKVEVKAKGESVKGILHSGTDKEFTVVTPKGTAVKLGADAARIRAYKPSPEFQAFNAKYGMLAGMALWSTPAREAWFDAAEEAGAMYRLTEADRINLRIFEREFGAKKRAAMADAGTAMPDGSFPIANASDLANAIQSIGRAKDYDAAKAHITKRARALGLTAKLPSEWGVRESAYERDVRILREKGKDDHFYGAWKGGSKAAGGGPDKNGDGKPELGKQDKADIAVLKKGNPFDKTDASDAEIKAYQRALQNPTAKAAVYGTEPRTFFGKPVSAFPTSVEVAKRNPLRPELRTEHPLERADRLRMGLLVHEPTGRVYRPTTAAERAQLAAERAAHAAAAKPATVGGAFNPKAGRPSQQLLSGLRAAANKAAKK